MAMQCPSCREPLRRKRTTRIPRVSYERCGVCDGRWLEPGELELLDDDVCTDTERALVADPERPGVDCPNCAELETYRSGRVAMHRCALPGDPEPGIDRCPRCGGYWVRDGGNERVRAVALRRTDSVLEQSRAARGYKPLSDMRKKKP